MIEVLAFTAFLIAALVLQAPKGYSQELLVLAIIYLFTVLKLFFFHVHLRYFTQPIFNAWQFLVSSRIATLSNRTRNYGGLAISVVIIFIIVFAPPENLETGSTRVQRCISLFGMVVFLFILWATSHVSTSKNINFGEISAQLVLTVNVNFRLDHRTVRPSNGALWLSASSPNLFLVFSCCAPALAMISSPGYLVSWNYTSVSPTLVWTLCLVTPLPSVRIIYFVDLLLVPSIYKRCIEFVYLLFFCVDI